MENITVEMLSTFTEEERIQIIDAKLMELTNLGLHVESLLESIDKNSRMERFIRLTNEASQIRNLRKNLNKLKYSMELLWFYGF